MKAQFRPFRFLRVKQRCYYFSPLQQAERYKARRTSSFLVAPAAPTTTVIIRPRVQTCGLTTSAFSLTYEEGSSKLNVIHDSSSKSVISEPVATDTRGGHRDYELNKNGEHFKEYDFEELLQSVREKSIDRRKKITHKEKRNTNRMMTIEELIKFLEAESAEDVCVIHVPPERRYVEYLVVCSGSSTRHIRRMADALACEMRHVRISGDFETKTDHRRVVVEGRDCEDWMAVDIGNIVVHFLLEEARNVYQIEKLWTLGQEFDDLTKEMQKYLETD